MHSKGISKVERRLLEGHSESYSEVGWRVDT
jgi:hypothetical protein